MELFEISELREKTNLEKRRKHQNDNKMKKFFSFGFTDFLCKIGRIGDEMKENGNKDLSERRRRRRRKRNKPLKIDHQKSD